MKTLLLLVLIYST